MCVLARDEALDAGAASLPGARDLVWAGLVERAPQCFVAVDVPTRERLGDAARLLEESVVCVLARDEALDAGAASLPGARDLVWAGLVERAPQCFVAVDVPTRERLGDAARLLEESAASATVDHHAVDDRMTDICYTDPDSASTSLLVWELIGYLGVEPSAEMATCAFAGLMTDTGRFQYQNADARAFSLGAEMVSCGAEPAHIGSAFYQNRTLASVKLEAAAISHLRLIAGGAAALSYVSVDDMAACGAVKADAEPLIDIASVKLEAAAISHLRLIAGGAAALSYVSVDDMAACGAVKADAEPLIDILRSLAGVRVACMLREQPDGVRGSLRAKDDTDVSALARRFGGGGHRAAAGFSVKDASVLEAVELLTEKVADLVEGGLDG